MALGGAVELTPNLFQFQVLQEIVDPEKKMCVCPGNCGIKYPIFALISHLLFNC